MDEVSKFVGGVVARTMRQGGFPGTVKVSKVKQTKKGYSAKVVSTYFGWSVDYRATVVGSKVNVKKVKGSERKAVAA